MKYLSPILEFDVKHNISVFYNVLDLMLEDELPITVINTNLYLTLEALKVRFQPDWKFTCNTCNTCNAD